MIEELKNNKKVIDFIKVWNELEKENSIGEVRIKEKIYYNLVFTDYIKDLELYHDTTILCDDVENELTIDELLNAVIKNEVRLYKRVEVKI